MTVFGVIHPDDRDIAFREIEAAIRQERAATADIRILCEGDAYKPFHVVANISREADGGYLMYTSYTQKSEQGMSIQEMIPLAISTMMSASATSPMSRTRTCASFAAAKLLSGCWVSKAKECARRGNSGGSGRLSGRH